MCSQISGIMIIKHANIDKDSVWKAESLIKNTSKGHGLAEVSICNTQGCGYMNSNVQWKHLHKWFYNCYASIGSVYNVHPEKGQSIWCWFNFKSLIECLFAWGSKPYVVKSRFDLHWWLVKKDWILLMMMWKLHQTWSRSLNRLNRLLLLSDIRTLLSMRSGFLPCKFLTTRYIKDFFIYQTVYHTPKSTIHSCQSTLC